VSVQDRWFSAVGLVVPEERPKELPVGDLYDTLWGFVSGHIHSAWALRGVEASWALHVEVVQVADDHRMVAKLGNETASWRIHSRDVATAHEQIAWAVDNIRETALEIRDDEGCAGSLN
jgi:hypothetical protein